MWIVFFFFKQKTAYEMRISDWSSDVCSSDLQIARRLRILLAGQRARHGDAADDVGVSIFGLHRIVEAVRRLPAQRQAGELLLGFGIVMVGRDRQSVV